jgi:hypothetical protein
MFLLFHATNGQTDVHGETNRHMFVILSRKRLKSEGKDEILKELIEI